MHQVEASRQQALRVLAEVMLLTRTSNDERTGILVEQFRLRFVHAAAHSESQQQEYEALHGELLIFGAGLQGVPSELIPVPGFSVSS